jgi:anti-anti-sigma factor
MLKFSAYGTFDLKMGQEIKEALKQHLEESFNKVLISFREVNYINSDGLRELLEISKNLKKDNKELIMSELNENVRELFHFSCLDEIFEIRD